MFDAVAITGEGGGAVEPVNGGIERGMGFAQIAGHGVGIIEVGKAGGRMRSAGVDHSLRQRFDFGALCGGGFGPWEGCCRLGRWSSGSGSLSALLCG
jgi:hypothetical protein